MAADTSTSWASSSPTRVRQATTPTDSAEQLAWPKDDGSDLE